MASVIFTFYDTLRLIIWLNDTAHSDFISILWDKSSPVWYGCLTGRSADCVCQGQAAHQPVTSSACDVIDSGVSMVETAKSLAANPQDPATHQAYSTLSHKLSDNINTLITAIRWLFCHLLYAVDCLRWWGHVFGGLIVWVWDNSKSLYGLW